jgi:ComF family protein
MPALDAFFPPSCVACDAVLPAPGFFCADCALLVTEASSAACPRCAEPGHFTAGACPRCLRRPPAFGRAWAAFGYEGAVSRAVHRFKYEDHPELARPLGELLARKAASFLASVPGGIVPLPLHDARYRERKYDQTTLLAVAVAKASVRALRDEVLTRVKPTTRQVDLSEAQREANVGGAFEVRSSVAGEELLLLDDVLTTGATAREATRVLLAAGAKSVNVLVFARAVRLDAR